MRVFVESDMTVCPDGHTLNLHAGETAEGPLARFLVASNCNVTIEEDDPAPATAEPEHVSHVPGGAGEQEAAGEQETGGEQAPELGTTSEAVQEPGPAAEPEAAPETDPGPDAAA